MNVILPFRVGHGAFVVEMPKGARVLSVGAPFETPTLWALVYPEAPKVLHRFLALPEGESFSDSIDGMSIQEMTFVGSFQLRGGNFVGHLFDAGEAS